MTKGFRLALMALAIAGFTCSAFVAPASAVTTKHYHVKKRHHSHASDKVRQAQVQLGKLGYLAGANDGLLGPATMSAIKQFQRDQKLTATGELTDDTYNAVMAADLKPQGTQGTQDLTQEAPQPLLTPDGWTILGPQNIPVRYGEMHINQETKDDKYRYTISFNGQTILQGTDQPTALQFSQLFQLKDEDALVVTTYRGEENCAFKNYLFLIHSNGESLTTKVFDSCAASNEVHQAFNALFVRFSGTMNKDGYDQWDVWRYEDGKLLRM